MSDDEFSSSSKKIACVSWAIEVDADTLDDMDDEYTLDLKSRENDIKAKRKGVILASTPSPSSKKNEGPARRSWYWTQDGRYWTLLDAMENR